MLHNAIRTEFRVKTSIFLCIGKDEKFDLEDNPIQFANLSLPLRAKRKQVPKLPLLQARFNYFG